MGRTSDTPEKLRIALSELMWTQSYGSVTIDAICEKAEVKKGSFYHFYKGKSDLGVDAMEYLWEECSRPWMDTAFSASEDPLKRVRNWLDRGLEKTMEALKQHGKILGCPFFNVGSEISTLEPELVAKVTDLLHRYQGYIANALRDASGLGLIDIDDIDATARDVLTLVEGAITQARISNDPEPLTRLPISVGRLIGSDLGAAINLTIK